MQKLFVRITWTLFFLSAEFAVGFFLAQQGLGRWEWNILIYKRCSIIMAAENHVRMPLKIRVFFFFKVLNSWRAAFPQDTSERKGIQPG